MIKKYISDLLALALLCSFFLFSGCVSGDPDTPAAAAPYQEVPLKPLLIKSGPDSTDLRLSIRRTSDTDTTTEYKLLSAYEESPLGLTIIVPKKKKGAEAGGQAWIKSLGAPTDHLLQVLARLYKQPVDGSAKFVSSISFTCMNLKDFYTKVDSTHEKYVLAADYKLFFDAENVKGDAEMYMNINPDEQWVEFREKDPDYRPRLIGLFRQH